MGDRGKDETAAGHDLTASRTTAPMSPFGSRELGYGIAFLVVGLVLAFGIPLVAAAL